MRERIADRELQRLVPFVLLNAWCAALLALRVGQSGRLSYGFLAWNLVLAAVPLLATTALRALSARRSPAVLRGGLVALWLLFLPNAPYLLTDLIHLGPRPSIPLWFDSLLILSFAGTGLAMAYRSVFDIEELLLRRFGTAAAVMASGGALLLCGFGIDLGRFQRLNSWDAITEPLGTLSLIGGLLLRPWEHPRTWAVTLLYGGVLLLGYLAIRSMRVAADPEPVHRREPAPAAAVR
jgi:uncharacterized membrane protein